MQTRVPEVLANVNTSLGLFRSTSSSSKKYCVANRDQVVKTMTSCFPTHITLLNEYLKVEC